MRPYSYSKFNINRVLRKQVASMPAREVCLAKAFSLELVLIDLLVEKYFKYILEY